MDDRPQVQGVRWGIPGKILAVCLFATPTLHAQPAQGPDRPARRLIEFGWDEPDTSFLRRHIEEMDRTPFDGCVFHVTAIDSQGKQGNFAWLGWGKRRFTAEELKPALEDLRATHPRRLTTNFLRLNTAPADLDWFDDHDPILSNARLAAKLAREGRCVGLLFDSEEYQGKLFTYEHQRDRKTKTWDEYASQASAGAAKS